jgi:hypothetical protein
MPSRIVTASTVASIVHLLRIMLVRSSDPAEEAEIRRVLATLGVFNT